MHRSKSAQPEFDYVLLILVASLLGFGLVMLFSASYSIAYSWKENPLHYFSRQLLWTILGLIALAIMVNINYRTWERLAIPILGVTLLVLTVLLIIGQPVFGSIRYFIKGSIQPSEIAKIAIIIYIAAWLAAKGKDLRKVSYGLIPFAVLLGLLVGLIIIQPDVSTALLIAATALAMFFIAGADLIQIGVLMAMGGLTFGLIMSRFAHTQDRLQVFIDSLLDPVNSSNFHVRGAIQALVEGGFFGTGLSESIHKHWPGGIPAVHSDSIFAIVGEELGLIGSLVVIALFFFFAIRGVRIALRATDSFGTLLAFGITIWLVLQAFINIAVITATFPFTGIPLPFFSYGGSSMLANLAAVGILLNISRDGQGGVDLNAYLGFWRRNRRTRLSNTGSRARPAKRRGNVFARTLGRRR